MPNKTLSLVLLCVLTGCTTQYAPPSVGPVAKVRLRLLDSNYFAMLHTYAKPTCEEPQAIGLIGGPNFVKSSPAPAPRVNMLGSRPSPDPQIIETLVRANSPLTILYTQIGPAGGSQVASCKLPVTFLPLAGGEYELSYSYDRINCSVTVQALESSPSTGIRYSPVDARKEAAACSPYRF